LVFDVTSKFLTAVSKTVPIAPAAIPAIPASKKPAPKTRAQKSVRN
jgi:hypothetical protein